MEIMKFETKITLYNSYFDFHDRLTTKSILNIFQDVASLHAEILNVGYERMLKKNLFWVLSRLKIDILKMPKPNQIVVVETWPHIKGKIDFDRDLRILSESGEVLIIGTSKWCVINAQTRALERTDNINYEGEYYNQINYEERFAKITLPDAEFEHKANHVVEFSDLDHNKHMNNTNYANLVLNVVENKHYSHFEINFNAECLLGDIIQILHTKQNNEEFIVGETNGKKAFIAYIK